MFLFVQLAEERYKHAVTNHTRAATPAKIPTFWAVLEASLSSGNFLDISNNEGLRVQSLL